MILNLFIFFITHLSNETHQKNIDKEKEMRAVCILRPVIEEFKGAVGIVTFETKPKLRGLHVDIEFKGLPHNQTFAIHIHEYGDLRQGCESLGGHWNPKKTTHGSRYFPKHARHHGDLINNIFTNRDGHYHLAYHDNLLSLSGKLNIVGRSVVVHQGIDDLGQGDNPQSLENGNSGHRAMCGVIGWAAS